MEYKHNNVFLSEFIRKYRGKPILIEGIDVSQCDFNLIKQYPVIFMNTSYLKSSIRATIRNMMSHKKSEGKYNVRTWIDVFIGRLQRNKKIRKWHEKFQQRRLKMPNIKVQNISEIL